MHFEAKSCHLGSGLSAVELLAYLHSGWLRPQDLFVLSKGHAASALYATLHALGKITDQELGTYHRDGTLLPAHPAPGGHAAIPVATGSLGHGLPIAVGMAYARRHLRPVDSRVACLISDGECNEGSVWEAALFAAHHRLSNLTVLIDANGLQGLGTTREVLDLEPLAGKWRAFGFEVDEIDGHDFNQIRKAMAPAQSSAQAGAKPRGVICRTVKGKGVSFMEGKVEWHYITMSSEQYEQALRELPEPAVA